MSQIASPDLTSAAAAEPADNPVAGIDQTSGNFSYDVKYALDAGTGLSERTVEYISSVKKEFANA